ncbi:hypothetical protein PsorP6_018748 [Peronosclerospora sorghi]|nr:hypothetical protein PsorP6_018748 [Peronosclerospora sorghi]
MFLFTIMRSFRHRSKVVLRHCAPTLSHLNMREVHIQVIVVLLFAGKTYNELKVPDIYNIHAKKVNTEYSATNLCEHQLGHEVIAASDHA